MHTRHLAGGRAVISSPAEFLPGFAGWTALLRCPACLAALDRSGDALACSSCKRSYPVVDGMAYLSTVDASWHENLREVVNYHYFYEKLLSGRIEADRLDSDAEHHRRAFEDQERMFRAAVREIDCAAGPVVVDVGAGMGETSQVLGEAGARVIATDMHGIDLAHPRFLTIGQPHVDLPQAVRNARPIAPDDLAFARVQCDSMRIPLACESADVVFSRSTWHHYRDLPGVLRECARILRPGGKLVCCAEPLRAEGDPESDHVAHVFDYQEGINETAPTWRDYALALGQAGFGDVHVRFFDAAWGGPERARRNRWWNFWRSAQPPVHPDRTLPHTAFRLFTRIQGVFNLIATRMESPPETSRDPGPAIADTVCLADVARRLPDIKRAVRNTLPTELRTTRIDCSQPAPREIAVGLRAPEPEGRFAFCHWRTRLLLAGRGSLATLRLRAVPGQEAAGMVVRATINDRPAGELAIDQAGESTWELPMPADASEVVEVMLEHNRLWQGKWPAHGPERELGIGLLEAAIENRAS